MNMDLYEVELPDQFICPFTKMILQEPVLSTSCGHHFERAAVEGRIHLSCPIDGIPLPQTLVPAREFKAVINHWLKLHKVVKYMETQIRQLSIKEGNKFDVMSVISDSPLMDSNPKIITKDKNTQLKLNTFPNSNKILKPSSLGDYPSKPIPIAQPIPQPKNTIIVPSSPMVVTSNNDTGSSNSGDKATVDPRKYKTKLCRSWAQTGTCTYEHTCCFAHGDEEIRDPAANIRVLDALGFSTQPKPAAEGPKSRSKGRGMDTKTAHTESQKLTTVGSEAKPLRSPSPISQESRIIYFSPEQLSELGVPGILSGENNSRPFPFTF